MVQKGVGCLKSEISVIFYIKQSLHNRVKVDNPGKWPAMMMTIAEIVGNVQLLLFLDRHSEQLSNKHIL